MLESSFFSIIFQGGIFSTCILLLLLCMSVISWGIITWKWRVFGNAMKITAGFLKSVDMFSGLSDVLYRAESYTSTYVTREFQAAYQEFATYKIKENRGNNYYAKQELLHRIERSIEKSIVSEGLTYENKLAILATISSSAPFIGLFGTVAGIIDAFYSIGSQGAASIAVVAPGISAALVATAFGLFAAIPALIAYNIFRNKTQVIRQEMESFGFELINLFDRECPTVVNKPRQTSHANLSVR